MHRTPAALGMAWTGGPRGNHKRTGTATLASEFGREILCAHASLAFGVHMHALHDRQDAVSTHYQRVLSFDPAWTRTTQEGRSRTRGRHNRTTVGPGLSTAGDAASRWCAHSDTAHDDGPSRAQAPGHRKDRIGRYASWLICIRIQIQVMTKVPS
jgi:hypothetical protein